MPQIQFTEHITIGSILAVAVILAFIVPLYLITNRRLNKIEKSVGDLFTLLMSKGEHLR